MKINAAPTFGEAFALARKELGSGKAFVWSGKTYTTNTEEDISKNVFDGTYYKDMPSAAIAAHNQGKKCLLTMVKHTKYLQMYQQ